jgi:hypothetical protein
MKTSLARITDNSLRLSNKIEKADTDGDGKLSAAERTAATDKLPDNVKTRFNRAVDAGGGSVAESKKALTDAAVKAFSADRNRDGFIGPKELKTLEKGSLERSLLNKDNTASVQGLEHRAMNAGNRLGDGLTDAQVEKMSQSQRPADRMAAQAWKDGGGTVEGARAQIAKAVQELSQADGDKNGRITKDEAAGLQSEAAKALFAQTIALRGRW